MGQNENDPAILAATEFAQRVLVGSVAPKVAMIAVAGLGLLMMTGKIDARRAAAIFVGCFLIFGAQFMTSSLIGVTRGATDDEKVAAVVADRLDPAPDLKSIVPDNLGQADPVRPTVDPLRFRHFGEAEVPPNRDKPQLLKK